MATHTKKVSVDRLTISEIKSLLKEKNLSTMGTIDVLRARLHRRYELEEIMIDSESEDDERENSEEEEQEEENEEEEQEEENEEEEQEEEEQEEEEEHEGEEQEGGEGEEEYEDTLYMKLRLADLEEKVKEYDLGKIEEKLKKFVKTELELIFNEFSKKNTEVKEKLNPNVGAASKSEEIKSFPSKPGNRKGKFYEHALDDFITEEDLDEKISDSKPYPVVTLDQLDRELKKYMSTSTHVDLPYFEEEGMSLLEFLDRRGEDISKFNYDTKAYSFNLGDENINLDADLHKKYETYVNGRTVTFKYCRIQPFGSAWIVFID